MGLQEQPLPVGEGRVFPRKGYVHRVCAPTALAEPWKVLQAARGLQPFAKAICDCP